MICIRCKKHATFEHTVFQGTTAHRVTLCPDCASGTGAEDHLARIKGAADRNAKHAAVDEFLKAVAPAK